MTKEASHPDYPAFLAALKERVLHARTTAARAVNRDLILLYWDIGRAIVQKQQSAGWGSAIVQRLAADLRVAFPDMRGFSADNLWRMKQFFVHYSSSEFLEQAVPELKVRAKTLTIWSTQENLLEQPVPASTASPAARNNPEILSPAVRELVAVVPWGHHVELLKKVKNPAACYYYLRAARKLGWSRSVLLNQIKARVYQRAVKEKKTNNFALALPRHFAEQADEMMKSSYNLEFLGINRSMKERGLESRLVERLQPFILELGYGFCSVGRQYRLALRHNESQD